MSRSVIKSIFLAWGVLALLGLSLSAQEETEEPAVPAPEGEIPFQALFSGFEAEAQSDSFLLAGSARRALGAGAYEVAHSLAVRAAELMGEDYDDFENELVIIDSLLAQSEWIEARTHLAALETADAQKLQRLKLREAMIAYAEGDADGVERIIDDTPLEGFGSGDAAWRSFLAGWVQLNNGRRSNSRELFEASRNFAVIESPALLAQIDYLIFRSLLESRTDDAETIPQLQNALLESDGKSIRFVYAQQLAVLLYDSGKQDEAIQLLLRSLDTIPEELTREKAQLQLLVTMAAGAGSFEGRQSLGELISANRFPELMSIALQQAFSRARLGDEAGGEVVRATLDQMIARQPEHLLLDQALYYRAVFHFMDENYLEAEADAATLQRRFPNSPYRRGMLALQASSAWYRERFRTAASRLQQMRSEFADLQEDFRLSALIADCYLRAGLRSNTREDFRNAAEAYSTALANVAIPSQGGPLFFQLVLARLRAGQLDQALAAIDNPSYRVLAGEEVIWQAQWMALQELRRQNRELEAYERAQQAVEEEASNPLLKLRLLWLTARLSVISGDSAYTEDWVQQIEQYVNSAALENADPDLLKKVMASSLLSLADARFAEDRSEEAIALLERIRRDYAGYEASLLSYIAQARFLSMQNRTVEAQQLLVSLADEYRDHPLAPVALFEAALNAERRGQDTYLDEATKLLERIANDYPQSEMVFRARLMQADLLRRLNKFGAAEYIYTLLEQRYSDRPDVYLAQLSLASTLLAQVNEDPSKFDAGISKLELLMDSPEVTPDTRIEAGYMLGQAWRSQGEQLKAKQIFWVLYDQTLVEEMRIRQLSRTGRYWLARSLFALAEISQSEGDVDQSIYFYRQIREHRLPGADLARARLEILTQPISAEAQ